MTNMTIGVIGGGGMLGRCLVDAGKRRRHAMIVRDGRESLDLADADAVEAFVDLGPDVIINAAGYTAVDDAEADRVGADRGNHLGVRTLARACARRGVTLVHYSTDYVFDGASSEAYEETSPTAPVNVYGQTKLDGEIAIRDAGSDHLILRTSWLFAPHGGNFVRTMLRLCAEREAIHVVNDQRGRPTYCPDLADMTFDLLAADARDVVNACNDGTCTWFELADAVVRQAGLTCDVRPCTTAEMPRPARRPVNSVLDLTRLRERLGIVPHWQDALGRCMEQLLADPHAAD